MNTASAPRREELRRALRATRDRIDTAAAACGRSDEASDIALIVVTKYFPAEDVAALVERGVTSIGESRDQEASAKVTELRERLTSAGMPQIHMIGQVQTKKARSVVRYADVVHSLDREKLASHLNRAVARAVEEGERVGPLDVTIQIDLGNGEDRGRGGVRPEDCEDLADFVSGCEGLRLRGVMAIAPDPARSDAGSAFARLGAVHQRVLAAHPEATWMSAGMSGDVEEAIAAGATHLRVGSAILGSRYIER
ncbi:MAG: YggS family pyridoxal phosphate-dependent enzyme [Ornithinimicrobium sp.]